MNPVNQPPMRRLTWKDIQGKHPKQPSTRAVLREWQKDQAKVLRAQGMAYEDIAAKLRCPVSFAQKACNPKISP